MTGSKYILLFLIVGCARFNQKEYNPYIIAVPLKFLPVKQIRTIQIWKSRDAFVSQCPDADLVPEGVFLVFRYGMGSGNTYVKNILIQEQDALITLSNDIYHDTDKGYPILVDNTANINRLIFIENNRTNFITNIN